MAGVQTPPRVPLLTGAAACLSAICCVYPPASVFRPELGSLKGNLEDGKRPPLPITGKELADWLQVGRCVD